MCSLLILHRMLTTVGCPIHQLNTYGLTPIQMAANSGHHQTVMELQALSRGSTKLMLRNKIIDTCENKDIVQLTNKLTTRQCSVTDHTIVQFLDNGWYTNQYTGRNMCDIRYEFFDLKDKNWAWTCL